MTNERLLDLIGQVDERYIEEADPEAPHKRHSALKWGALAACLALAVLAGAWLANRPDAPPSSAEGSPPPSGVTGSPTPSDPISPSAPTDPTDPTDPTGPITPDDPPAGAAGSSVPSDPAGITDLPAPTDPADPIDPADLPMLTVTTGVAGGYGYEGYWARDISELVNGNPWTPDMELDTLPVYENVLQINTAGERLGSGTIDADALLASSARRLKALASLEVDGAPIDFWYEPGGYPPFLEGWDGAVVTVGSIVPAVSFWFEPGLPVPEIYNFYGYFPRYSRSSYKRMCAAANYLLKEYGDLTGLEDPVADVSGGDSNRYGKQSYDISFYESGGTPEEQILNYNFNRVEFLPNADGDVSIVRKIHYDLSKKLGDYPIITLEEAEALLAAGHFVTSVTEEFPGAEYAAKVELVYRTSSDVPTYMPYYKFLVELPQMEGTNPDVTRHGLKDYGVYYVPAVEGRYIANMPQWDGSII